MSHMYCIWVQTVPIVLQEHMEKQEMEVEWKLEIENGDGNWKRKWLIS